MLESTPHTQRYIESIFFSPSQGLKDQNCFVGNKKEPATVPPFDISPISRLSQYFQRSRVRLRWAVAFSWNPGQKQHKGPQVPLCDSVQSELPEVPRGPGWPTGPGVFPAAANWLCADRRGADGVRPALQPQHLPSLRSVLGSPLKSIWSTLMTIKKKCWSS